MLKLTKRRFINKRKRNNASMRRKRQVGGAITLPTQIVFRVYEPPNNLPTRAECVKNPNQQNCKDLIICPEKWHTKPEITPGYLYVDATKKTFSAETITEKDNLLETLNTNYEFKINYKYSTFTMSDIQSTIADSLKSAITRSQESGMSLTELRAIINDYYYRKSYDFAQYIGKYSDNTIIAWCDVFTEERGTISYSSIGRHGEKLIPEETHVENMTWQLAKGGPGCEVTPR
jgi:hypothetical protein